MEVFHRTNLEVMSLYNIFGSLGIWKPMKSITLHMTEAEENFQ
jgi:hypothetical protein